MLLTIEKVLILKSVSIFSQIPEDSLVEVAAVLEEIEVKAGETIFKKGDIGTAMYIIIEGQVRVHDEDRVLDTLKEREVFGELAALDPVPRSATVTATEDTYLFRMYQGSLYELMSEYIDVAQGIIRVLCQRIRDCDSMLSSQPPGGRGHLPSPDKEPK